LSAPLPRCLRCVSVERPGVADQPSIALIRAGDGPDVTSLPPVTMSHPTHLPFQPQALFQFQKLL